jgi:hypothetical protein
VTEMLRSLRASSQIALIVAAIGYLSGCSHKTEEQPSPEATRADTKVAPLQLMAPPTWHKTEESDDKPRRAGYAVPKVGDDKEDGEALVLFFGTGSAGDRDKQWDEWFGQFDGNAKQDATRGTLEANGMQAETFEILGTYKLNMGPHRRGQTKSPVQMVKEHFRMIGVVLHTKDRGNWFFRLVGPDATVQAARSDFIAMIEGAK